MTLFVTLFSAYGTLLVLTQYWQNVRDFPAIVTGLLILPFALAIASGIMSSQRAIGSTAGYAVMGTILAACGGNAQRRSRARNP